VALIENARLVEEQLLWWAFSVGMTLQPYWKAGNTSRASISSAGRVSAILSVLPVTMSIYTPKSAIVWTFSTMARGSVPYICCLLLPVLQRDRARTEEVSYEISEYWGSPPMQMCIYTRSILCDSTVVPPW
jgi:hypothetical protein